MTYRKYPAKELRAMAKRLLRDLPKWFEDHPKRKTCVVELWYGRIATVKRENFKDKIENALKEALNERP